jgi:hypothetical protein
MFWLRVAAFLETVSAYLQMKWLHFQRRWLLPVLVYSGRDMFLLKNGIWVDAGTNFTENQIAWRYDSIKHHLIHGPGAMQRWQWVSAVSGCGRDMSDFFADLRISRGSHLNLAKIIELFIYQKGWVPTRDIRITRRDDATEETIYVNICSPITDAAPVCSTASDVNFIH